MKTIRKLDAWLARGEQFLAVLLLMTLAVAIVLNILSRHLGQLSPDFILEYSPVLVLWLALIGSSLAIREQRHIKLEIFLKMMPPRLTRAAHMAASAFAMIVMGILFVAAYHFVQNEVAIFGMKGWPVIIFPVFFALAVFRFFLRIADLIE